MIIRLNDVSFTPSSDCKDIGIRKFEFAVKSEFLYVQQDKFITKGRAVKSVCGIVYCFLRHTLFKEGKSWIMKKCGIVYFLLYKEGKAE